MSNLFFFLFCFGFVFVFVFVWMTRLDNDTIHEKENITKAMGLGINLFGQSLIALGISSWNCVEINAIWT